MTRDSVTVRVPGSTSNCGAGFDTLGLALSLYNVVTVTRSSEDGFRGERGCDARAQGMVADVCAAFQSATGRTAGNFVYKIDGDVPAARGLGSSITVIAGILAGLDGLHDTKLTRHAMVEIATSLEGHPDNASAGILGGFCVSRCDPETGRYVDTVKIALPETLAFVVASPPAEMLTKESRGVLPASLRYFDAVKSINSATYLVAAIASGDFSKLAHAVTDFMHEPYRLPLIKGGRESIAAGVEAGAYTGWLSGSGSSVLCVTEASRSSGVSAAMASAFGQHGVAAQVRILSAENEGMKLIGASG